MPKSIALDFYYGIPAEAALLSMKGVTKLIADTPGIADGFVYVSVRVSVYPVFDTAAGYEVAEFRCESSVNRTPLELV